MSLSEFTVQRSWISNRSSSSRWLASHISRNWIWVIGVFAGALANAALAGVVPVLTGQAFDVMQADAGNTEALLGIALLIAVSQVIRGLTQIGRNFSSEVLGQRMERDARD